MSSKYYFNKDKKLKDRINNIIPNTIELKFLVGFFYFSGWNEIYLKLKENQTFILKLLVGLEVDKSLGQLIEYGNNENYSIDDKFMDFKKSLGNALNNNEMDNQEFYEQVDFFLDMIESNRLLIRKTKNPNHAKLYLFKWNEMMNSYNDREGTFITGSSNLTKAGLSTQGEFNVEISDTGFEQVEEYFDELWESSIPLTEDNIKREVILNYIRKETQVAKVTPFEAYAYVLKNYVDLSNIKKVEPQLKKLITKKGFKNFSYQMDAVEQALNILDKYNGVIIADVVGLGKSVIASLIGKSLGKRGIVICPPGLMGKRRDKTGWYGYLHNFELDNWEVESKGQLETLANNINDETFEVIVIDEAHYFRNEDTKDHEFLNVICKNKKVILLTATPFNNSPLDFLSLISLFEVTKKSNLIYSGDLEGEFREMNAKFKHLSYIKKNYNSSNPNKSQRAERYYKERIEDALPIDLTKVDDATKDLSNKIRSIINPILIRRNRIDLKNDKIYSSEIDDLSIVKDPVEMYYELTTNQSKFYDEILEKYFAEDGIFTGAIYQPFTYSKGVVGDEDLLEEENKLDETENRQFQQQRNLYDFMRRLLVKRFESSFGAFVKSIDRFIRVNELSLNFIEKTGKFILDRKLMENIAGLEEDEIEKILEDYEYNIDEKKVKNNIVYEVNKFISKDLFINNIKSDLKLFQEIKRKLNEEKMIEDDPKRSTIFGKIREILTHDKDRKIIIFSEYVDTVKHLQNYLDIKLKGKLLVCDGSMSKSLEDKLETEFNAQTTKEKTNKYQVLLTSDKLAEGYNLNRAGAIINYDIPWNPTKVIQRVGRINRIGTKVFDELHIYNYFPTEAGSDYVKTREIASQKMFLIHNVLGEDAKIFDADEKPEASKLFEKIQANYEDFEELSITTKIRNIYFEICEKYPEVIEKISLLPPRIKSSKKSDSNNLIVLRRKALSLFYHMKEEGKETTEIILDDLIKQIECGFDEVRLELTSRFWDDYQIILKHSKRYMSNISEKSLTNKAIANLKQALRFNIEDTDNLNSFISDMLDDLKNYKVMSEYTIGRIARIKTRIKISINNGKPNLSIILKEIQDIRRLYGENYLSKVKDKINAQEQEVIIAIENQKLN